jgi:hypothetical protein
VYETLLRCAPLYVSESWIPEYRPNHVTSFWSVYGSRRNGIGRSLNENIFSVIKAGGFIRALRIIGLDVPSDV